uniref:Otopetrin-2 n=1 Tax=Magallana gigas TaxID=29159 RepID=A0A8W8J0V6_MAGGI
MVVLYLRIVFYVRMPRAQAGIVVIFGVLSGEKANRDEVFISKWAAIALCICVGLLAVLFLLVLSCRQRPDVIPVDEDPSINLQLVFLWGFGLAMMIYLCINIAIYLRCAIDRPDDYLHSIFRLLVNLLFILFTVFQMVLLTYNKRSILRATIQFHFSIVCILAVNFALWYSSTVHTLFVNGNETEFSNVSCFHSSEIQKRLGSKISLILLPPQMEFYILASTLLIALWRNSIRYESTITREPCKLTRDDSYEKICTLVSMGVKEKHLLAVTLGLFINIPIVLSAVLLDFVYEWQNKSVVMFLDFSDSLSALFSCVLVYVSCIKIKRLTVATTKPFLIRDYILILSSTGMMAYFMIGVVASMSGYTLSKSTVVSRVFGMLETFLQTYLLTRSSRHKANGNCRESTCISFCALILVISNLTYWLLDSYNKHMITKSRYIGFKDWKVVEVLFIPLVTFYRFFSGMGAYSMYKRFKPN